ncbi:hypothetical protein tb265_13850 [Gemmatimonadetes bacterium T265]|nr:hypothetical protein tb265_13850 [Gemmatimonadetes bacterium T265]
MTPAGRRSCWAALPTAVLVVGALTAGASAQDDAQARTATCGGQRYSYTLETPASAGDGAPRPAILLLRGAGGCGAGMLAAWRPTAARERLVLIAPDLPTSAAFEPVAPAVFRCMVADARRVAAIDSARVYLSGYSMGGYLAFDGALLAGDVFAGAAVYGAAIADEYAGIVDSASRRPPFALYIGDHDAFYSTAQVRRTRDLLAARGFPVRYVEFPNQDHAYASVAAQLNADAWAYLGAQPPPAPVRRSASPAP